MDLIYLTKEQAEKVRGRHGKYSELQPIPAEDGSFVLPLDVLKDPEHKDVLAELLKCRTAECNVVTIVNEKLKVDDPEREKQVIRVMRINEYTISP